MRRGAVVVIVGLMTVTACATAADVDVTAERTDSIPGGFASDDPADTDGPPATGTPAEATNTPTDEPNDTADGAEPVDTQPGSEDPDVDESGTPADDTDDLGDAPDATETGLGDELFPDLGAPAVDVLAYVVQLDVDVAAGSFDAMITVDAAVAPDTDELVLDAAGFTVDTVTVDAAETTFTQRDDELIIALPDGTAEQLTATITYSAAPDEARSAVGLPAGWFQSEGGSYVLNEPDGARRWMPANDHPSDKATWRFEITVPDDLTVSANGDLEQEGSDGEPWIWSMDEAMPTYLVHLVIGEYDIVDGGNLSSTDGDAIELTHVVPRSGLATFQRFIDVTPAQFDFFEARFGPYPLDDYGLAFVDSVPGLAMETQGRSLFSRRDFERAPLAGDTPIDQIDFVQHLLLGHELAHQWFGNAVSPATWSDIWLNESFATYAQFLWLDEIGRVDLDTEMAQLLDLRQNGRLATGTPTVDSMFGFESYEGGSVIVHALRLELGDDAFFELLSQWIASNNGTSQTTDAFVALAQDIAGADLTAFFDDWLYSAALPAEFPR